MDEDDYTESESDMVRYPKGTIVKPDECNLNDLKKEYGGALPNIKGRKVKYPSPTDEAGWKRLYAAALTYKNKQKYALDNGLTPPKDPRKTKFDYILFHAKKSMKQDRSQRNKDRRINGLKSGDKLVVHHLNPKKLKTEESMKMTHCQHQRAHGKVCEKEKKSPVKPKGKPKPSPKNRKVITVK